MTSFKENKNIAILKTIKIYRPEFGFFSQQERCLLNQYIPFHLLQERHILYSITPLVRGTVCTKSVYTVPFTAGKAYFVFYYSPCKRNGVY